MNNTIETEKRKKEVPFVELVHKSLVAHGIIINPNIVNGERTSMKSRDMIFQYTKALNIMVERTARKSHAKRGD